MSGNSLFMAELNQNKMQFLQNAKLLQTLLDTPRGCKFMTSGLEKVKVKNLKHPKHDAGMTFSALSTT